MDSIIFDSQENSSIDDDDEDYEYSDVTLKPCMEKENYSINTFVKRRSAVSFNSEEANKLQYLFKLDGLKRTFADLNIPTYSIDDSLLKLEEDYNILYNKINLHIKLHDDLEKNRKLPTEEEYLLFIKYIKDFYIKTQLSMSPDLNLNKEFLLEVFRYNIYGELKMKIIKLIIVDEKMIEYVITLMEFKQLLLFESSKISKPNTRNEINIIFRFLNDYIYVSKEKLISDLLDISVNSELILTIIKNIVIDYDSLDSTELLNLISNKYSKLLSLMDECIFN